MRSLASAWPSRSAITWPSRTAPIRRWPLPTRCCARESSWPGWGWNFSWASIRAAAIAGRRWRRHAFSTCTPTWACRCCVTLGYPSDSRLDPLADRDQHLNAGVLARRLLAGGPGRLGGAFRLAGPVQAAVRQCDVDARRRRRAASVSACRAGRCPGQRQARPGTVGGLARGSI